MAEKVLPEGFHEKSTIKEMPISELRVDRSYQRVPSMAAVDRIAEDWSEVASELILVSNRGERDPEETGGMFLVNGQHRTLAARKIGKKKIWARIVDLSDVDDPGETEASLRLKTNIRLGDRPLERFRAQVRAGDEDSLAIQKILDACGTHINEQPSLDDGINAVATVEGIYAVDQGATLRETLETLRRIYPSLNGRVVSAASMKGFAWFIQSHSMDASIDRLIEKLGSAGSEALYRRAIGMKSMMGGSEWMNYYRAILEFYNDGLREKSRLEPKMRGSQKFAQRAGTNSWNK